MSFGVNLVCADRAGESIMTELDGAREPVPQPGGRGTELFFPHRPGPRDRASLELGQRVGLRPNDPNLPIELLSGGNQQKAVVGRWLHLAGKLYVFEDPTAGVDVGAKAEIYLLFDVALRAGAAIVIVSTDFEEVAKVCHRALVFDRGRVVAELAADDLSVENLLAAASASIGHSAKVATAAFNHPAPDSMQSIKSNALEPTRSELAALTRWRAIGRLAPVYGLPILTVLLIVFFSILLPTTFPTYLNFRSILADKAIIALLSLAATLPMMAGRIDLTVGFGIVMWHILAMSLLVNYGVPWPLAIVIVVACGGAGRPDQRPACRGGAGRLLHRHARHRHHPLRARAVAHRWAPDHRRPAAGFIAINTLSIAGIPIARRLRHRSRGRACGSSANGCRSAATSTRSARTRRRPRSTASRSEPI